MPLVEQTVPKARGRVSCALLKTMINKRLIYKSIKSGINKF